MRECDDMQKRVLKWWIVEGEIQIGNQRFDYERVSDQGGRSEHASLGAWR